MQENISINQIIMYLRKSRSDDPCMTVEEVLARHERQLQDYAVASFGSPGSGTPHLPGSGIRRNHCRPTGDETAYASARIRFCPWCPGH